MRLFFANQKRFYDAFMTNGKLKDISEKALQTLWDKLVKFSNIRLINVWAEIRLFKLKTEQKK